MINRTKQRQELLSKLKPNSSVVSSSTASESNQMVVVKETTGNGSRKEKENNCLSTSNKTTASIKPTTTQPTISKATGKYRIYYKIKYVNKYYLQFHPVVFCVL